MSSFCIVLMLFATQPNEGITPPSQSEAAVSQYPAISIVRQGKELEEAAHAALRHWAKVDKAHAEPAAREFIAIFDELKQDTLLARSTRRELGGLVRGRLARLAEMIPTSRGDSRGDDSPPTLGKAGNNPAVLGQLGGGVNRPGGMGNPNRGGPPSASGGNSANAYPPDSGEALVELIRKTIAPSTWDVNGGPGTIQYWRPGHALVVRASDDVQEQIGGLVGQLH
jgi:hypothetical protein